MKLNSFSFLITTVVNLMKVILSSYHEYSSTEILPFLRFTMSKDLLFVGGDGGIVALNKSSLAEIYSTVRFGSNWLLLYNRQNNTMIQCSELNGTSHCQNLDTTLSNSANEPVLSIKNKTNSPVYVLTTVLEASADVIVIGATLISIGKPSKNYGIITLDLTNLTIFDTLSYNNGPMNLELGPSYDIVFQSIIPNDNFIFFFFELFNRGSNTTRKSIVGKLCKKTKGNAKNDAYFHSYEDIGLKCKIGNTTLEIVVRAVLVNDKTVVAIFTNGSKQAVCTFSVKSIISKMTSERRDQLECNYNKTGSYFKPNLRVNNAQCFKNGTCLSDEMFCSSANGLFCNSTHYSTLWNGTAFETINYLYSATSYHQLTTIAVQSVINHTLMFLGTDDGYIIMVYVKAIDDEKFEKLEERKVKVTSSSIIDILIEEPSGIVFVLTKNQVIKKLFINNCLVYDNCASCQNSLHPNCSWNIFGKRCEEYENISGMIPPSENCFEFDKSNKKRLIRTVETNGVNFSRPSLMNRVLTCSFGQKTNLTWTIDNDSSVCVLENFTHLSPGNYTLELRYNGTLVASEDFELIKCSNLHSCKECHDYNCTWNLKSGICAGLDYNDPHVNIEEEYDCPAIVRNITYLKQIYYRNQTVHVRIKWSENVTIPSLMCKFTDDSSQQISTAKVHRENSSVTCKFTALDSELPQNRIYKVLLLYEQQESNIDGYDEFEVYTCSSNPSNIQHCKECRQQQYPEDCHWCSDPNTCYSKKDVCESVEMFCSIILNRVVPSAGPVNGGTTVTLHGHNFVNCMSVKFESTNCEVIKIYEDNNILECTTLGVTEPLNITNITITVNQSSFPQYDSNRTWFEFKKPEMTSFHPNRSIVSGGRLISIVGPDIGFYGRGRYKINFLKETYNETSQIVECRNVTTVNDYIINCLSGSVSYPVVLNKLEVIIDDENTLQLNQSLTYVDDPSGFKLSDETSSVQQSGGAKITINGEGFHEVGNVTIDRVKKTCKVDSDTLVECETPKYSGSSDLTGKVSETVNVYFDGLAVPITIDYVADPIFEKYRDVVEFDKAGSIEIKGRNILAGARWNDYTIYIGKTGLCYTEKKYVSDTFLKCWPPQHVPLTNYTDKSLVYVHVKVGRLLEHIGVLKYVKETNHLVAVISVLAAALVIAVAVGVGATLRMRKKRKKDEKKFVFELQSVEERVRTNSREEFAETQIAIGDIQSDLVTSKVPYRDYQTYILLQLFPNQDPNTNSLLPHLQVTNGSDTKYKEAMEKLELLLQNKLFLKSVVQTLDKPNTLTVQEKAQFAALLSIALLGNMRLFYDLVHCLLTDSIRSVTKRLQRGLFRRLDSITCRMMTNWLQIVLFKQLRGQYGIQLFMLVKAVQTVIERGPVDAVTGHCKNTLCEEKLLKLRVDSEQYILNIDLNGNPDHCFQVKVLKCDTISQVKRKCCSQIYKNKPASEIPKFEELILEWKEGHAGTLLLQDVDQTSERTDVHVRLNTLSHYKVGNDCRMALLYGIQKDDNNVNLTGQNDSVSFEDVNPLMPYDSERDEYLQKSHLSTSHVEEGPNLERDIGDIYLNRLFHTKLLLSKYIDSVFEGLLDSKCVSLPISYFIQNLDELGRKNAVDPEVLQIWKNECYATRIWAPLIGKPQAAFDIHVPGHIEPIMDVLSQVFVECLTQKTFRVNKKSPTQRLLFHKDIERYRKFIPAFYDNLEPVAGHDFWKTLDELSDMQQEDVKFSRHSTIHQLYNLFIAKYKNKILNDFEDMEESSGLQFGQKLEEIFELMEK